MSATIALPAVAGLTAATANAAPSISQLAAECRNANGGTWTTAAGGYHCYYTDASGDRWVDIYDRRGRYVGTS